MMCKTLLTVGLLFAAILMFEIGVGYLFQFMPRHRLLVGNTAYLAQVMPPSN